MPGSTSIFARNPSLGVSISIVALSVSTFGKGHIYMYMKWVNEVGFFPFFLKIPVWLACYAHGFHGEW